MKVAIVGGVRKDITVGAPSDFRAGVDRKTPTGQYDEAYGGSAARAAKVLRGLDLDVELVCKGALDAAGELFTQRMRRIGVAYRPVMVPGFPAAVAAVTGPTRAALLYDDPADHGEQDEDFPHIDLADCSALYLDGRLGLAAVAHARKARDQGIPIMFDGCAGRTSTDELLLAADFNVVSEHLVTERGLSPLSMLDYLKSTRCSLGAVTLSEYGLIWFDREEESRTRYLPALSVSRVVSTYGAGDVFHSVLLWSILTNSTAPTVEHLKKARAGAAHVIQHSRSDVRHPRVPDIETALSLTPSEMRHDWIQPEWMH